MTRFALLAEDRSDVDALVVLIKRIIGQENATIPRKGFGGCGELRRKAHSHIAEFSRQGATHFIICHDSDKNTPQDVRNKVIDAIKAKMPLNFEHIIVVPVQELEAWIIADEAAIHTAIPSLTISSVAKPEEINDPKEWLIRQSQTNRTKPLYAPATFNVKVARHLEIDKVKKKCRSFKELVDYLQEAIKTKKSGDEWC